MIKVHIEYDMASDCWRAMIGDKEHTGTKEECLQWMRQMFANLTAIIREVKRELSIQTWADSPYANARGEE